MLAQHQTYKLQIQPQTVSGSYLSLFKAPCFTLGINTLRVTKCVPSNIDPHSSRLLTQKWFVTFLICDLELNIIMPTYRKIYMLDDLASYMSAGINLCREIYQIFCDHVLSIFLFMVLKTFMRYWSVVTLNLKLPCLHPIRLSSWLIYLLIYQPIQILTRHFLEACATHIFMKFFQ